MVDFKKELEKRHKASLQKVKDFGIGTAVKIADTIAHPENLYGLIPALMPLAEFNKARRRAEDSKRKAEQKGKTPVQDAAKARKSASSSMTTNNVAPIQQPQRSVSTPRVSANTNARDIQSMIVRIAKEEGVDPALALSIAHVETGGSFNPNAVGDNGNSFGLFQIHRPSHPDYKGGTDPEANARYGIRLFKRLLDANNGSVNKAIWAYNAGQGNVNRGILPATTKNYLNMVAQLGPQYRQAGITGVAPVSQQNRAVIQSMAPSTQTQGQGRIDGTGQQAQANTPPAKPDVILSTPAQDTLLTQLQSTINDPRNEQLSIPTMYYRLMDQYDKMYDTIQNQDPRYQGGIQTPQNPYYVDPRQLERAQAANRNLAMLDYIQGRGPAPDQAGIMMNNAQQMYQAQLANQAGVPYSDYQAAMLDRQKQMILARAAQIESQLQMAAQNEDNVFRKQQLLQNIEQNKVEAQNAMNGLEYKLKYGSYDAANDAANKLNLLKLKNLQDQAAADLQFNRDLAKLTYENELGIKRDQAKPMSQGNIYAGLTPIMALAGYDNQKAGKLIQASGMGSTWFPQMTPELAKEIWGQPSQGQQQGFFGRLMSGWKNNVGLQANEQ
ncbi:lytic transglycosylase domain-containing protein [Bullifex porci]|uniref:lytic transglycosylase domain-containing protein n=1 Tax=Bullifex porci TaxID=2606638 RepID=UPI0023F4E3C9|nr:transglycosylase SLT domain-containing protein [Bullifex porci]MDD7588822.1 transglycosylase SLT domain-containing protein [Bullifex porci]